jgi:two-component system chemotaxis response regulator CheY
MKKILVVDDSPVTRVVIAKMLESFGFETIQAQDGVEALKELAKNQDIKIALVDWNMPTMTGIDLLRQVRCDSKLSDLKIIMVTTENEMHSVTTALNEGVDEYIMLPLTSDVLKDKLALLGIYPLIHESRNLN